MRSTSRWLTSQWMFMVAVVALGWVTTAAAADGLLVTGQTTCYRLERYPAGHAFAGEAVVRDALGNPQYEAVVQFDATGSPLDSPAFDPNTGRVNDQVIPCKGTGQDGQRRMGATLRYTDKGDGRIHDWNTGLQWAKKSDDDGLHDKDNTYTWDEAFAFINTMNNTCQLSQNNVPPAVPTPCMCDDDCPAAGDRCGFAGKRDWRLPNVRELQTLVNFAVFSDRLSPAPTVHPVFNTNCVPGVSVLKGSCTHADDVIYNPGGANDGDFVLFGTPDPATGLRVGVRVPFTYWSSTTGDALGDAWFVDYFTGDSGAHFKDADFEIDTTVCDPNCSPANPPDVTHAGHVRAVRADDFAVAFSEAAPAPPADTSPPVPSSGQPTGTPPAETGAVAAPAPPADTTPPRRSSGRPTGTQPAGTTEVTLSFPTNEAADCRYAMSPGIAYSAMTTTLFGAAGGTFHIATIRGLANGGSYAVSVRCRDAAGNVNADDYTIVFSVAAH